MRCCLAAGAAPMNQREENSMHRLFGLVLAGGILLGHAAAAQAQIGLTVGNPFTGTALSIGNPGYGYGGYGTGYGGFWSGYGGVWGAGARARRGAAGRPGGSCVV